MSRIELHGRNLYVFVQDSLPITCANVDVLVRAFSDMDENKPIPVLGIGIETNNDHNYASVVIEGYAEIDALRRYCEMTLALFDRGHLERNI